MRAGSESGLMFEFEIYQGANTGFDPAHTCLGLGGAVVLRLTSNIPRDRFFKVFFDNFFTSVPLMRYLKKREILSVGVVKGNRVATKKNPCPIMSKAEMKKKERGTVDECATKKEIYL